MIRLRFIQCFCVIVAFTAFGLGLAICAAGETAPVMADDVQVLTSGPIHEAFAEAIVLDPEPGIVAPKAPPVRYRVPKAKPNVEPLQRGYNLSRSRDKSQKSRDRGQKSEALEQSSKDKVRKSRNKGWQSEDRMQKSNDRQQKGDDRRQRWNER